MNRSKTLFTSERLAFRLWNEADLIHLNRLNSDARVMKYFPGTMTPEQNQEFLQRMQTLYNEKGHCFFALELKDTSTFIGFTGIGYQTFPAPFTPLPDIGWRLLPDYWNEGYAHEAALRCLDFARYDLGFNEIHAMAPAINTPSVSLMKKLGMTLKQEFLHPHLLNSPTLAPCVLYHKHL